MNRFILRQSLLLLLTAGIWGVAFVAQSVGMDYIGPFTFNAVRSLIGAMVLLPCIALFNKLKAKEKSKTEISKTEINKAEINKAEISKAEINKAEISRAEIIKTGINKAKTDKAEVHKIENKKTLVIGGIICGIILAVASSLQQFGLLYTTVGKAGFITAMYIILVPLLGIFFKKRAGLRIWLSVLIAVAGLYLLCMKGSFRLEAGDILVLICAVVFSFHIMAVDHFSPLVDGVKMSCIQFLTCGILCSICMFLFEQPDVSLILAAWKPVLYAGVMSCGVAYTLQIVGQKGMNPTVASLIMSLESVISVLAGFFLLHEVLSRRELIGCILMFAAIVLAQLPEKKKRAETEKMQRRTMENSLG